MLQYTKLKEHERKSLRDLIPLPKPFTLVVEPSSLCNFCCDMCFHSVKKETYFSANKANMPMELYAEIVKQMREWDGDRLKVLKLSLYGEPLINKSFCAMLKMAKEAGISERIETTSNVSLLTEDISEKLVKWGLDYIRVSTYSPVQEKHERITASSINIDSIRRNLESLANIKARLRSSTPFIAVKILDTYSEENELFKKMYKDVADELYIETPHNWIGGEKDFLGSMYGADNEDVQKHLSAGENGRFACGPSFYMLAVRNNGDISPCCVDWLGGTNIGNMSDITLREVWQGEPMRSFWYMQLSKQNTRNKSCRNCNVYKSDYYARDDVDGVPTERLFNTHKGKI